MRVELTFTGLQPAAWPSGSAPKKGSAQVWYLGFVIGWASLGTTFVDRMVASTIMAPLAPVFGGEGSGVRGIDTCCRWRHI